VVEAFAPVYVLATQASGTEIHARDTQKAASGHSSDEAVAHKSTGTGPICVVEYFCLLVRRGPPSAPTVVRFGECPEPKFDLGSFAVSVMEVEESQDSEQMNCTPDFESNPSQHDSTLSLHQFRGFGFLILQ